MKLSELVQSYIGVMTLDENDSFIAEMANFLADVTDLPANIVLWTKPQPDMLPHDKYRMKVFKNRIHVSTYSIGVMPKLVWNTSRKKYALTASEQNEVVEVISKYFPIFIQLVDSKLTTDEVKYEIKRMKGTR